jgi:hypothetical protein
MAASMTFILSTGRIGSIFLAQQLKRHPQLRLEMSAHPSFRYESFRYLKWRHRAFGNGAYRQWLPLGFYYRRRLAASRRRLLRGGREHFVEINNYLFPMLPELKRAFPSAGIIHIIRDPRTFLPSALNRGWGLNPHDPRMTPLLTGEMTKNEWKGLSAVAKMCWYWLRTNAMIQEAGPVATITFERVFGNDHSGLGDLLEAIGVSRDFQEQVDFKQKTNQTPVAYVAGWKDWPREWKEECRPYFERAEKEFTVTRWYPDLLNGPT